MQFRMELDTSHAPPGARTCSPQHKT
jgi:hypothetical protein